MRLAVEKADASRQANPRRRLHPRDMDLDYRNLRDLERLTFHVQDVTQVLSDVIWAEDTPFVIPDAYAAPLGDAMASVGDVLRAMEEEQPERQAELAALRRRGDQRAHRQACHRAAQQGRPERGGIHPREPPPHAAGGQARPAGGKPATAPQTRPTPVPPAGGAAPTAAAARCLYGRLRPAPRQNR